MWQQGCLHDDRYVSVQLSEISFSGDEIRFTHIHSGGMPMNYR